MTPLAGTWISWLHGPVWWREASFFTLACQCSLCKPYGFVLAAEGTRNHFLVGVTMEARVLLWIHPKSQNKGREEGGSSAQTRRTVSARIPTSLKDCFVNLWKSLSRHYSFPSSWLSNFFQVKLEVVTPAESGRAGCPALSTSPRSWCLAVGPTQGLGWGRMYPELSLKAG